MAEPRIYFVESIDDRNLFAEQDNKKSKTPFEELIDSIERNDIEEVERLEELIDAIERNDTKEVERLLPLIKSSLDRFVNGKTLLHIASEKGYHEIVEKLIKKGADTNLYDKNGKTPAHLAAQNNHLKVIENLAKSSKFDINKADNHGQTILHYAANHKNTALAKELINKFNCNVSIQDNSGKTALHYTAMRDIPELAEKLLDKDPNLKNIEDKEGKLAVDYLDEKSSHRSKVLLASDKTMDKSLDLDKSSKKRDTYKDNSQDLLKKQEETRRIDELDKQKTMEAIELHGQTKSKIKTSQFGFGSSSTDEQIQKSAPKEKVNTSLKDQIDQIKKEIESYSPSQLIQELYSSLVHGNNFRAKIILLQEKIPADMLCNTKINGETLLHVAAQRGNGEIYHKLVNLGSNPEIKNDRGLSASCIAIPSKSEDVSNQQETRKERGSETKKSLTNTDAQHPSTSPKIGKELNLQEVSQTPCQIHF